MRAICGNSLYKTIAFLITTPDFIQQNLAKWIFRGQGAPSCPNFGCLWTLWSFFCHHATSIWMFSKNRGKKPKIIPCLIGFSLIFTIGIDKKSFYFSLQAQSPPVYIKHARACIIDKSAKTSPEPRSARFTLIGNLYILHHVFLFLSNLWHSKNSKKEVFRMFVWELAMKRVTFLEVKMFQGHPKISQQPFGANRVARIQTSQGRSTQLLGPWGWETSHL